ncbi:MAG: AAA family ATPase [Nitriliruptorales bacterium]
MKRPASAATSLIGRNRELSFLRVALSTALDGGGALVLLGGEAGIGKTRLASELAGMAEARRATVAWGSGVDDATPPFWPWVQVLRRLSRSFGSTLPRLDSRATDLAGLLPDAPAPAEPASLPAPPGEARQRRLRLFQAVATLLEEAARRTPVLIVLDDLLWADTASQLLLEFVANRLSGKRILIAAAYRDSEAGPGSPASRSLTRLSRVGTTIGLGGLTAADSMRLVRQVARTTVSDRVAMLVHERSGGNPFVIRELTRLLESQGRLTALSPEGASRLSMLPEKAGEVIFRRTALPDENVGLLAEASVIGVEFGLKILSAVSETPEARLFDLLDRAVRAEVIHPSEDAPARYRFTHQLIRETLYHDLPASRRGALQRRVGEALEAGSDDLDPLLNALAHHFYLASLQETAAEVDEATAGPPGEEDDDKALLYARRAGWRALQLLAYEEAAEHFTHALELLEDKSGEEPQRTELLLARGDAHMRAGEGQGAAEAFELAASTARRRGWAEELARAALGLAALVTDLHGSEVHPPDQRRDGGEAAGRAGLVRGGGEAAGRAGLVRDGGQGGPRMGLRRNGGEAGGRAGRDQIDLVIDLLEDALTTLGQEDSPLRAWLLARLSVVTAGRETLEQRSELSRQAIRMAREVGDEKALAYALGGYCDTLDGTAHAEERLESASEMVQIGEETLDAETELLGRRLKLTALLELGDIAGVDDEVEAFARRAEAVGLPAFLWYVPLWRGMRALMEGRLADAERFMAETRTIGRQASSLAAESFAEMQRLVWLIEAGHDQQAGDLLTRAVNDPAAGRHAAEPFLVPVLARRGRRAEARAVLDRLAGEDFSRLEVEDTAWLLAMCMLAWGCAELGEREAGAKVLDLLQPYAERFAISGPGAITLGSVSRYLGLLAATLDRWGEAEPHFRRALEAHRRAGAPLLIAHTLREYAAMLLERGDAGDRVPADGLLDEAISIYNALDLTHWCQSAGALPGAEPEHVAEAPEDNVIRREADVWLLRFEGEEARVEDSKGMADIARLLANPGKEFHVLEFVAEPVHSHDKQTESPDERGQAAARNEESARAGYRRRLAELEQEIEQAETLGDPELSSRAQVDRQAVLAQLTTSYGIARSLRSVGNPTERARTTISSRIRTALARIDRAHPALGAHLDHSIRLGTFCSYSPERAVSWALE